MQTAAPSFAFLRKRTLSDIGKLCGMDTWQKISAHLSVFRDAGNVGVLRDGGRLLLIDPGDATPLAGATVDTVLITHYHRDGFAGAPDTTRLLVPATEAHLVTDTESYWTNPAAQWHAYNYRPFFLVPATSRPVAGVLSDNDTFTWGSARITVLATPGHTNGSLSYLVEVDGRRVCFTGDLLYAPGQFWDLYSLQQGGAIPGGEIWDYHGFLGARTALYDSFLRISAVHPDLLVPAHGELMSNPIEALTETRERLEALHCNYAATSALHHYFPELFTGLPPGSLQAATEAPPSWLRHDGTTWVLSSASGAAFVMDCGSAAVVTALRNAVEAGEITGIEGLWVTHYHDDHVDGVPNFQQTFACPLYADTSVADVITTPDAWRLPCLSPAVCRVDHATTDGEQWQWREFTFTAYHFPGQTHYHGGLFVEGRGRRLFFVGDSFAPTGMDDYCPLNRNSIQAGDGFDACLALLEQLRPDALCNPHIDALFTFSSDDLYTMRNALDARRTLLMSLTPWNTPDAALDPFWLRLHPYMQTCRRGDQPIVELVVTNTTSYPLPVHAGDNTMIVPPTSEGRLPLHFPSLSPGRQIQTLDMRVGDRLLPAIVECLIIIE